MPQFLSTIPLLFAGFAGGLLGCESAPAKKAAPSAASAVSPEEPRGASLGPGMTVAKHIAPRAIALWRDAVVVAGMGEFFAMRPGERDRLGLRESSGAALDVAVLGDRVFVAEGRAGLTSYTMHATGQADGEKRWDLLGECKRVVAAKQRIAVLCGPRVVTILQEDRVETILAIPGNPADAAWIDNTLFLACPGDGIVRVDVNTERVFTTYTEGHLDRVLSVVTNGSRLFAGLRDKRVLEIDPMTGRTLGSVTPLNRPVRLIAGKNQLLIGSTLIGDPGATWVDISTPGDLRVSARLAFGVSTGVQVGDDRWMVIRPEGGMVLVGHGGQLIYETSGVRWDRFASGLSKNMAWAEDRAVAWNWTMGASEVSAEARMIADATACGSSFCTLEVSGRLCVEASEAVAPTCVDIANGGASLAFQASKNALWVIDASGNLHQFSITTGLTEVTTVAPSPTVHHQNWSRLAIDGDLGVAIDPESGLLQVFDLGNTPRLHGRFLLQSQPRAVALVANVAFVAEPRTGVQVIGLDDPDKPRELALHLMRRGPFGVAAQSDAAGRTVVVLAEGDQGISVWHWAEDTHELEMQRRGNTGGIASDVVMHASQLFVTTGARVVRYAWAEFVP